MKRTSILFLPAVINFIVGGGIYYYLYFQSRDIEKTTIQFQYWLNLYVPIVSILLFHLFVRAFKKENKNIFHIKLNRWEDYIIGFIIGISGGIGYYFLTRTIFPTFTYQSYSLPFQMWNMLGAVVIAPITEEFIFRRYAQFLFSLKKKSLWMASTISGLSFSLWHANPYIIPSAFFVGIIFYLLYIKTNNLLTPIIAHMALNFIFFLLI